MTGMTSLAFSLLPVLGAVLGAAAALLRAPGLTARSYIQHFAAGVVFSVVGVELLPDIPRRHEPLQTVVGFSLGVAAMLAIKTLSQRLEAAGEAAEGCSSASRSRRGRASGSFSRSPSPSNSSTAAFLVGFLVFLVIGMLEGS